MKKNPAAARNSAPTAPPTAAPTTAGLAPLFTAAGGGTVGVADAVALLVPVLEGVGVTLLEGVPVPLPVFVPLLVAVPVASDV